MRHGNFVGISTSGIYQVATSHEILAKIFVIPSSIVIYKTGFWQQTAIKSHLQASLKLGHFGCFDASIIMWDKVGEYELEGNISIVAQHEELENP